MTNQDDKLHNDCDGGHCVACQINAAVTTHGTSATLKNPWPDYEAQPLANEGEGFALEHAMQIGFHPVDDEAEIYAVRQVDLLKVMASVRGFKAGSYERIQASLKLWQGSALHLAGCIPDDIRAAGWSIAVHNDYRLAGERMTFWLFTKGHQAVKGEGRTDREALDQIRTQLHEWGEQLDMVAWR